MAVPVIDISHHQDSADFALAKASGVVGVIHKATEGSSNIDGRYTQRHQQAEAAGLLWGAYHFLRPGNMQQQAQHFISVTGINLDVYVADHEDPGVSLSDLKAFLREVQKLTGKQQLVIYSGHLLKDQLSGRDDELAQHRLWLAQYTSGTPSWETATWPQWWLWQYTDSGSVPGITPPTDCNKYDGTTAELIDEWTSGGEPPAPPKPGDRTLHIGDSGQDVAFLQMTLALPADGEFGAMTEAQVMAFQAAAGLDSDGIVGNQTWSAIDELIKRKVKGSEGLPPALIADIIATANDSPLVDYNWPDRGRAPPGYIPGMALTFAQALTWLNMEVGNGWSAAQSMAQPLDGADKDALKWLESEIRAALGSIEQPGPGLLRQLFVVMIGLGMRESSGQYYEGRDQSASNTSSDTCEAGLFQTSWNIRSADSAIAPLLDQFWQNPNGFLPTFRQGLVPNATDLDTYGTGGGACYQFLAKYAPSFAAMVTAVGLRTLRQHWGPINRKEVTIRRDADDLLRSVEALVGGQVPVPPEPGPEPEPETRLVTVALTVPSDVDVRVMINGLEVFVSDDPYDGK